MDNKQFPFGSQGVNQSLGSLSVNVINSIQSSSYLSMLIARQWFPSTICHSHEDTLTKILIMQHMCM